MERDRQTDRDRQRDSHAPRQIGQFLFSHNILNCYSCFCCYCCCSFYAVFRMVFIERFLFFLEVSAHLAQPCSGGERMGRGRGGSGFAELTKRGCFSGAFANLPGLQRCMQLCVCVISCKRIAHTQCGKAQLSSKLGREQCEQQQQRQLLWEENSLACACCIAHPVRIRNMYSN